MKTPVLLVLALLLFNATQQANAFADSTHFDRGMARYLRLQYNDAGLHFVEASKENVAEAFTLLAMMHYRGQGVPQNSELAVKLAKEGVTRGDLKALYVHGHVALDEPGAVYNMAADPYFVKAGPAMQQSANQGNAFWLTRLAYCYGNGLGVAQDLNKALELYRQAATTNYAIAFHGLGYAYLNGRGVELDYEKALMYFRKAAALGLVGSKDGTTSEVGIYDVAYAYHHGENNLPQDLTKAMALYAESAAYGYGKAYTGMGRLQNQNFPKAKEYLLKAIEAGDGEAATELALHYLDKDTVQCRQYYELALKMNDNSGFPELGFSHLYRADKAKAQRYAFQALAKGAPAQYINTPEVLVGEVAPDFQLKNPEGNLVSLSSLRGNFVLIDFWASWCGPCRQENPNVVKLYNEYHVKGFEILGVSLDESQTRWAGAIAKDGLLWLHVSDLRGWQSAAGQLYSVAAIPQTVLLDKEGKVLALGLRGEELREEIQALLK
jgi:TPR repeat protein/peroxiredoxin